MRAMSEAPREEEDQEEVNIVYSPTNSATTGFSGASSLGLHYKGSWCTPPRIFVDKVIFNGSHCFENLGMAKKLHTNFEHWLRSCMVETMC